VRKFTYLFPSIFRCLFQSSRIPPLIIPRANPLRQAIRPFSAYFSPKTPNPTRFLDYSPFSFFPFPSSLFTLKMRLRPHKKSLIITKHFLDFKNIYGIIPPVLTKEQTFGPKEPQGIKGIKMGSRRSTTRQTPSASNSHHLPHCFRLSPSTSSPLPPLSPFQLAQKCAPASPQVQNPALKCARPFLNGFKMRAACAPRCANFPKNPIFSPKTNKTAIFDNTPTPTPPNSPLPKTGFFNKNRLLLSNKLFMVKKHIWTGSSDGSPLQKGTL